MPGRQVLSARTAVGFGCVLLFVGLEFRVEFRVLGLSSAAEFFIVRFFFFFWGGGWAGPW